MNIIRTIRNNLKIVGIVILSGLVLFLAIIFITQTKPRTGKIEVCLLGDINSPKISPKYITAEKGDVVILYPPKNGLVKKVNFRGKTKIINPVDIFTFTIPGKKGTYSLKNTGQATAFKVLADGQIVFGASYPSLFSEFTTIKTDKGENIVGPVSISFLYKFGNIMEGYAKPIKVARPSSLPGVIFSEWNVELKEFPKTEITAGEAFDEYLKGLWQEVEKDYSKIVKLDKKNKGE